MLSFLAPGKWNLNGAFCAEEEMPRVAQLWGKSLTGRGLGGKEIFDASRKGLAFKKSVKGESCRPNF
jgi:hypothetical protein